MGDIFFFIKMIVMSAFFILVMQIRIGQETLEERSMVWLKESSLVVPLQEVADGGVVALSKLWDHVVNNTGDLFNGENLPGKRTLGIKLERSKAYVKDQLDKANAKIAEIKDEAIDDVSKEIKDSSSDFVEEEFNAIKKRVTHSEDDDAVITE